MDIIIGHTVLLFLIAIVVALAARKIHLPYTVGLVITGMALPLVQMNTGLNLTREFIFDVILPPLLFEAALNIHWKELKRDLLPILLLAVFGVIIAAFVVAWGIVTVLHWAWEPALVFGVLIAATDPVAVIAMFKDNGIKGRLRLLVESESLFNDGVAAVLFALVMAWSQQSGAPVTTSSALQSLALTVGGGMAVGALFGIAAVTIAGRSADHIIETALTTIAAYGSFVLAEHFHVSGVLAAVTAGLIMGNVGLLSISARGRTFILEFWEFIAFLANSLIFLLIGLRVATIPFAELGVVPLTIIIALVTLGRATAVYPICMPFLKTAWSIPVRHQHILWWAGLRGALGLALTMSLPESLAMHDQIEIATFGTVAFSVVLQGLTMPGLLKFLKCNKE